jgi:hypothetical protein
MKKPFSIVILGLLLTANGMASDKKYSLFGVIIGDDINNYNPKAGIIKSHLIIDPPKPNKNFVLYWAAINKKTNEIYGIGAYHKDFYPFGFEISSSGITDQQLEKAMIIQKRCKMETELFVELIVEGDQFNKFNNNLSEYDNSITSSVYIFEGEKINYGENGNIKFSVAADCSRPIRLYKDDPFGVRPDIKLIDHRNLYQIDKDNDEFNKAQTDKSGLQ